MPAVTNQTNASVTLQLAPPREPLPEPFWRTYGWAIAGFALLVVAGVLVWARIMRRPKPAFSIPPAIQARRALEALRGSAQSEALASQIANTLRRFLMAEFSVPAHELTTPELSNTIRGHPTISSNIAAATDNVLRRCDAIKFAPHTTAAQTDLLAEALELVDRIDAARANTKAVNAAPPIIASR
jgi:hypothetical protein